MKNTIKLNNEIVIGIPDLVNNRYNTVEYGKVWYLDITHLGNYWALVIMEASSKRVLAYTIKESKGDKKSCGITSEDCIKAISKALAENEVPEIIHGDNGGQFKTKKYQKYLKDQGIKQSLVDGSRYKFGNQVIERLFRTLKKMLRDRREDYEGITKKAEMIALLDGVISNYNDKSHKGLLGLSPMEMEDALTLYNPLNEQNTGITGRESEEAERMEKLRAQVIEHYAGNWLKFFIDWQASVVKQIRWEMSEQNKLQTEELKIYYEGKTEEMKGHYVGKIEELKNNLEEMESILNKMELRAKEAEAYEKMQEERKRRRKERKRKPIRDAAGLRELKQAIKIVEEKEKSSEYVKARDIVCLSILYLTGIRVSNLLELQVTHIRQLIQDHKFDLALIKSRKSKVQTFYLPQPVIDYFMELEKYYKKVIENKEDKTYVITEEGKETPITKWFLMKRLNEILKEVSKICHKNIKTHSFRINLTTALIEAVGIEEASKVIGHSDIRTTELYNRRSLSSKELLTIINKAHKHIKTLGSLLFFK